MDSSDRRTSSRNDPSLVDGSKLRNLSGTRLGDFEVERLIGRGGMGEVYLGRQISLNREVAIKVLRPDLQTNATYIRRFEVEAWSAAKLNHPNIVTIYLLGDVEGLRFIVMEYVRGTNLREYLLRKGRAELALGLSIMRQAGMAVGAAGEVGLVHRDIKPENLLITKKGLVKVADFGLSRDLDSADHDVTQPGVTIGTPLYMSPEQARGLAMDHRSDLYSLGITFYHLFAGDPPFRAETALALAMKHVTDRPVDLSVHRPDLPPELVKLVMKLINKAPEDRYQSAGEMLRDLAKIRESIAISTSAGTEALAAVAIAAQPGSPSTVISKAKIKGTDSTATKSLGNPLRSLTRPADGKPWINRRWLGLGLAVSLASGLLAGWMARPGDLLSVDSSVHLSRPAAWLAPNWPQVPRKTNPAAQYRYAQMLPGGPDRDAAWVAVAEFFPGDRTWSSMSYTQMARELFRRGDSDRLEAFAQGLRATRHGPDETLATVIDAGVAALDGETEKVLQVFDGSPSGLVENLMDPALADFGLEITLRLKEDRRWRQSPSVAGITGKLAQIQAKLIAKLIEIKRRGLQG